LKVVVFHPVAQKRRDGMGTPGILSNKIVILSAAKDLFLACRQRNEKQILRRVAPQDDNA
jgi:hypothetical protein